TSQLSACDKNSIRPITLAHRLSGVIFHQAFLKVCRTLRSCRSESHKLASKNAVFSPNPLLSSCPARLCPLSFGEGVEFDPLPPKEIRYTSSVKYDSEKHFIDDVYMPVGLGISSCSQTVVCIPDCTWRSYKAEVHFEPRNKPLRFASTTIVYPKHTKTVYTTTLDYNCRKSMRRFLSSIELESAEYPGNDYLLDGC
uniref:Refilin B n=1 Tax=Chrysemys picta bellii TaxID=8478 RepID=A0A8C3HQP6_CHRPI